MFRLQIREGKRQLKSVETTSGYRWIMLAGVWLIYASFGAILGAVPPLVVYISGDLELSRAAMGSVLGAWQLLYIFFAIPAGAIIDRLGRQVLA